MQSEIQVPQAVVAIQKSIDQLDRSSQIAFHKRFVSKKETANLFHVSLRTLERWIQYGYIRKVRVGGRVYFSKAEIDRVVELYEQGIEALVKSTTIHTADDIISRHLAHHLMWK